MIEFKFPCPNCGQRIQATDAYAGRTIQCPACQKYLVVPHPSGAMPPPPLMAAPPAHPILSSSAPIKQGGAPAGRKSRTAWVIAGSATALVLLGAAAWIVLSGALAHGDSRAADRADRRASAGKDAGRRGASNHSGPSVADIMQKVTEQYQSFTNYSALGTSVSLMDMSKVSAKSLPGMKQLPGAAKNAKAIQQALSKPIRSGTEFSVKLGRPNLYRIEWDGATGPVSMKGAAWSAGEGDFISIAKTKYTQMDTRELAVASATGVSGGAAGTLPGIFFNDQTSLLNSVKNLSLGTEEMVDGEDCYVLEGDTMGVKVSLWVAKNTFLLKQKRMTFGTKTSMPDVSDKQMEEGLKKMGNLSPDQKAQAKAAMKNMKPLLTQMRGTMTETYREIETNQPVKKADFQYQMPPGATLSKSLFAN